MRSTKNTRAVVVGIFVFIGLAIFILTVLTLGGQKKTFSKSVVIRAVFDDINGLQKGNNIWFSGVKVGTVKKISFYGKAEVEVDMSIEESARQYIRKNAKAKISSEGMIGNKIVVILPGAANSPGVEDGDMIGVEKALSPDEMMTTFQANNKNLLEITNDVKVLSEGMVQGKGTVGKMLNDETLFNELQNTMTVLKKSALNAQKLSSDVAEFTAKLDRKGTLANDLVTDTTIVSSLKSTIARMEEASIQANSIVNNLNTTSNDLNNSLKNTNTPAGMLLNDRKTADEIRVILRNLNSSSQKLDEDLEAVQHNFLLRGFFRKKAKEAEKAAKEREKQAEKAP
jgi:phospholipid/cholesterol/gamma-HCH transport system substrate-binding protein